MKFRLTSILMIALAMLSCKSRSDQEPLNAASTPNTVVEKVPKIVAFGDSLTAGLGLATEDTYPAQLQKLLNANGYKYEVVNAGVSGDTTSGGLRRIDWTLDDQVKIVILELGANDFLRGTPISLMKQNLSEMIETIRGRGAIVVLAGMEAPTNSGPEYRREVHEAYRELAKKYQLPFIPFLLQKIVSDEKLMQEDLTHPNAEGSKVLAETVYQTLQPLLQKQRS